MAVALHTALMLAALRDASFTTAASHLADAHQAANTQPPASAADREQVTRVLAAATVIWQRFPGDPCGDLVDGSASDGPMPVVDDPEALRIMLRAVADLLGDLDRGDLVAAAEKLAAIRRAGAAACDLANPDAVVLLGFADLIRRHYVQAATGVIDDCVERLTGPDGAP